MAKTNYYKVVAQSIPPKRFKSRTLTGIVRAKSVDEILQYGNYMMNLICESKDEQGNIIEMDYKIKSVKIIPHSFACSMEHVKKMLEGKEVSDGE